MLHRLIKYIALLPTVTTSPLALALATPANVAAQGGAITIVPIFDVVPDDLAQLRPPYVLMKDTGISKPLDRSLSNGTETVIRWHTLAVEVAAYGADIQTAQERAEGLLMTVEAVFFKAKANIPPSVLKLTDLGGTASYKAVTDWLTQADDAMPRIIKGGGNYDTTRKIYTSTKMLNVQALVESVRTT